MTLDREDVRNAYLRLQETMTPPGRLAVADTAVTVAGGNVVLALDASGHRCVLVPSDRQPAPDRASRGVSLATAEYLQPDLQQTQYLVLRCERLDLSDLFELIAVQVISSVERDPSNPEKACYAVLERFRDLFGRPEGTRLSMRQLAPIFGELIALEAVVREGGHVEQWKGPEGHRHDLIGPRATLEVKSTLSAEHRRMVVHGASQLEPAPGRRLFLLLLRVEPAIGGDTVQDLVDRIVGHGGDREALRSRLALLGYQFAHADDYRGAAFSVLAHHAYRVDEAFPRLPSTLMEQLPAGISDLQYVVDLNSAGCTALAGGLAAVAAEVVDP